MITLANIVRPASWNAKMILSGEPLITNAQFERLLANGQYWEDVAADTGDFDPVPVVKIFLTHIRWLVGAIYPSSPDRCFVLAKFAQDEPEFGETGPFGVTPERDKYIRLDKPMSWYAEHLEAWFR